MSPTILREGGYHYFFFSREEMRMHVHVRSEDGEAKYWLEPKVELAKNHRLKPFELRKIESTIKAHYDEFVKTWKNHFAN